MMRDEDYAGLTLALTWLVWMPLVWVGAGWLAGAPVWLWHVGYVMPGVAAAVCVAADHDDAIGALGAWLRRQLRLDLDVRWLVLALGVPFLALVVAGGLTALIGVGAPSLAGFGTFPDLFPGVPGLAAWALYAVLIVVPGELGWRGWLLPRLQGRMSALLASGTLAAAWAVWQLPLFLFDAELTTVSTSLAALVAAFPTTVLATWIYNGSGGSVLTTAVWSTSVGLVVASPLATSPVAPMFLFVIALLAMAVMRVHGPEDLAPTPRVTPSRPAEGARAHA